MQTSALLRTLFEYKAWANGDLLAAVGALSEPSLADAWRDAIRILTHVLVVDLIFQANMQCHPHSYTALNRRNKPDLDALKEEVLALDRWYLGYVDSLDEIALEEVVDFIFVDGSPGRMSRAEMLLHVVTHGNYHRGAVGRILSQASVSLPRDTLTVFLHPRKPGA